MNRSEIEALVVGSEIAVGRWPSSMSFREVPMSLRFGTVTKVTATQVTVALAPTATMTVPEVRVYSRKDGQERGKSQYSGTVLLNAEHMRERQAKEAARHAFQAKLAELKRRVDSISQHTDAILDEERTALVALVNSL